MTEIIVKDNYLPQDLFDYIYSKSLQGEQYHRDTISRYNFSPLEDPTPEIADLIHGFKKKRSYKELGKIIHTAGTPPNFHHPIHDEAEFKIMSAVLYLGPEKSHGTRFLMDEEFEIEWKPNRLMVFCGETGVTWHDFKSGDHTRYTYNYFLVDPTKVQNETLKKLILRM